MFVFEKEICKVHWFLVSCKVLTEDGSSYWDIRPAERSPANQILAELCLFLTWYIVNKYTCNTGQSDPGKGGVRICIISIFSSPRKYITFYFNFYCSLVHLNKLTINPPLLCPFGLPQRGWLNLPEPCYQFSHGHASMTVLSPGNSLRGRESDQKQSRNCGKQNISWK